MHIASDFYNLFYERIRIVGQISRYVFSVVITAIICSLINNFLKNFKTKEIGRFICGIALTISVLAPIANWTEIKFQNIFDNYSMEAQAIITQGKEISYEARSEIIKSETETYILDKAAALDADISVRITIAEAGEPIPVSVVIFGQPTSYTRNKLEEIIEEDLGISKENQQWCG